MIKVDNIDLTLNCEAYESAEKVTSKRWIRNSLTGKLYREKAGIDGAVIRFHVIDVVLSDEERDQLLEKYQNREPVFFTSDEFFQKNCIIVEDEFRVSKIAGADAWKGTIAFEEIEKIN